MTKPAGPAPDRCCAAERLSGPAADRSCGYINFFTTARAARAWARRHPGVTGTLMRRDGALKCGIAEFGALLQTPPTAGTDPGARSE